MESAYDKLLALKQKREEYVRISQENNMWEGTKKILTDMYPDTAHFVYELLQNAEDMHATEVKFILYNDKLVFTHNGSKRDFVYEDIDSITSIGNNTLKKNDLTSIGTFGVGFKAVYTYTSTPEIHSGEYDFRIRDMFVPDPVGVPRTATQGVTQFIFPFDHKAKKPEIAVSQIRKALLELDEDSILFLNYIQKIIFRLPNGFLGGLQIIEKDEVLRRIDKISPAYDDISKTMTKTYWMKFSKNCSVKTDKGDAILPISLAFKMSRSQNGEQFTYTVDEKLKGKVFIYFPAVKENSNLHFHIHAPFASTVARDSVRDCVENDKLIEEIARLAINSVYYCKERKLIDYHYYAALPNHRDFQYSTKYKRIYDELIKLFNDPRSEFIISENGEYKKIHEVLQGNREIVKLIDADDLYALQKRFWIPALRPQTREETFLDELGLKTLDIRNIIEMLQYDASKLSPLFERHFLDSEWFTKFYSLLGSMVTLHLYVDDLKSVKMLKCDDGQLHSVDDGLFLKTDYIPKQIKNPLYVELSNVIPKGLDALLSKSDLDSAISFCHRLGVRDMAQEIDLMADIDKGQVEADDVVIKLLEIIEIYKKTNRIEQFTESEMFIARKIKGDDSLYRVKAKDCCWDDAVAFFYENEFAINYVISQENYRTLSDDENVLFKKIFELLGGKTAPEIKRCAVSQSHPQWNILDTANRRSTEINTDYTITGLDNIERIPKEELYAESLVLWNVVVSDKNILHHEAKFAANSSKQTQTIDSRIAYYLRRVRWIPNKAGIFCRPCDIAQNDLYEGFLYVPGCVFLSELGFGDSSKAPDDITSILEKAGVSVSALDAEWFRQPDAVKAEFIRFMEERDKAKHKSMSLTEALNNETKEQAEYDEDDSYGRDIGVSNPNARIKRQQEEFEAGLKKSTVVKPVMTFTYNSKTSAIEKQFVREQYKGHCQICNRPPIRKHNGDIYFEAVNIIGTGNFDQTLLNDIDAGWNTLCLCPTCAAEYKYCAKNLSGFENQVETMEVEPEKNEEIVLQIELKNQPVLIRFTPRHFIALKAAFMVYKKHENRD